MATINNLPDSYLEKLIGVKSEKIDTVTAELIEQRLTKFDLQDLVDPNPIVTIPIPETFGDLDTEIVSACDSYAKDWDKLKYFIGHNPPELPSHYNSPTGWSRWDKSCNRWKPIPVGSLPSQMVLDIETVEVAGGQWNPTCCIALSPDGWYLWRVSVSNIEATRVIPFPHNRSVIGYNVGYDRSYLSSEYYQTPSGNYFYDLMSMFVTCRGMSNQQRTYYTKVTGKVDEHDTDADDYYHYIDESQPSEYRPPWMENTSTNGLAAVYNLYTGKNLDKGVRDEIVNSGLGWVSGNLSKVIAYCALDVLATLELATQLIPEYDHRRPSAVSRSGAVALGSCWLPMDSERFPNFYTEVETKYQAIKGHINSLLLVACDRFLAEMVEQPKGSDILDWTPALSGKNKGKPAWFRKALGDAKKGELTLKKRFIPFVLGLKYGGQDLEWVGGNRDGGWYTADGVPVPHPKDKGKRLTSLFVKDLLPLFESGFISCPDECREAVNQLVSTINWVQMRKRVQAIKHESPEGFPVVVPRMVVNGTITGRATESVWQVLPNPKKTRLGTELKTMIAAPDGYTLIGADVASQEAWLAGIHGDQQLGHSGSTPFGLMNACGSSQLGTDIHSVIAKETGMTRDATKPRVYGCVPMDAQALTKSGWKYYNELNVGDLILAYNAETNLNHWTPITHLSFYENAPLVALSNGHNFTVSCTPNHRWYTTQRHRYERSNQVLSVRTTDRLVKESNIITTAPSVGGSSTITPDEAALIAWLMTDGSVCWSKESYKTSTSFGTKRGVCATVVQKKEPQVSLLRALLEPYLTSVSYRDNSGCYVFRLKAAAVRDLWEKAGLEPDKENYIELITNLSPEARKAFLEAFWLAEGHTDKKGVKHVTQNVGSELDSLLVAAYMEGYDLRQVWKDRNKKCKTVRLRERRHVTCQRMIKTPIAPENVWCPTTALGTWVMRQGDTITITGNSLYGQGVKGDSDLLMQNDPTLANYEAREQSKKFIGIFKGDKRDGRYIGGIASSAFTRMEEIADSRLPRTPLTKAVMSRALAGVADYKPTRVNWVVQASGVDFRDLLVLLTESFFKKLSVDGRLVLTIHDEIRCCVLNDHIQQAAYALQLAHLYTRAAFLRAHNLSTLPAGVAWFPEIDVDRYLRKNPKDPSVTPSQPALPVGYALTPQDTLNYLNGDTFS